MKTGKEYIESGGNLCPYCESENITGGHGEFDYDIAWRNVSCRDCGESWTEEFTMTGVTELEP